jgi:hypothetical protein
MKIVILAMLIVMSGCTPPMIKAFKNTKITVGPSVIDRIPLTKKRHKHTADIYKDDTQWCEIHQKWERVSVTYKPSILSKLRYREYNVEE